MPPLLDHPHNREIVSRLPQDYVEKYINIYSYLYDKIEKGKLPMDENYFGGNGLAASIYRRNYYLRNARGDIIENRPEEVFVRVASFLAAVEEDDALSLAEQFYKAIYNGVLSPAGRIRAGAGDLFNLKTLSNCYFLKIEEDSIESIWKTSYQMARTYSYGGGVGTDVTPLRPTGTVVHNASSTATGPVGFMYLYSVTTGVIGQNGRRGALMITIDVKHPDVIKFIRSKRDPDWWAQMFLNELSWRLPDLDEDTRKEIERVIINNLQIRFANISVKFTDEFFMALEEQDNYGPEKIVVYERPAPPPEPQQDKDYHFSQGIPSKDPKDFKLIGVFNNLHELEEKLGISIREEDLKDPYKRDIYGDYVVEIDGKYYGIRYAGDFLLYYANPRVGKVKRLVKARDIWNVFVEANWSSAEPGLIFWSHMVKYSPSNYVGVPIMGTNPCGEVPLEHGGACVLSSLNLLSFVDDPFTERASFNWERFKEAVHLIIRFLDNVVEWNIYMHPLEDQKKAMKELRRVGAGVMGLADMLIALGMEYDSEEAISFVERVFQVYLNEAYKASSLLASEKGTFPRWTSSWMNNPYFSRLDEDTQELIKENGLRNVTVLAIAPTGNTSNTTLALRLNEKNYVGVSSGIEPLFALYYTRRVESEGGKTYRVFHPSVQAYLDLYGLSEEAQKGDLKEVLPSYFFKTAHTIDPLERVKIQGAIQRWVDGSISSTVNLPEDIHPETVSEIYKAAWRYKLKGITIYREGSRFAVILTDGKPSVFAQFKKKRFRISVDGNTYTVRGDEVLVINGRLTTVYHLVRGRK